MDTLRSKCYLLQCYRTQLKLLLFHIEYKDVFGSRDTGDIKPFVLATILFSSTYCKKND